MRNKATQLNALTNLTLRENIGKTMLCLLMCLTSLAAQAQQVEYPCDSYIEKARYDKAEEKIAKALVKEPLANTLTRVTSWMIPAFFKASGVTSAPAAKAFSKEPTLT